MWPKFNLPLKISNKWLNCWPKTFERKKKYVPKIHLMYLWQYLISPYYDTGYSTNTLWMRKMWIFFRSMVLRPIVVADIVRIIKNTTHTQWWWNVIWKGNIYSSRKLYVCIESLDDFFLLFKCVIQRFR